MTAGLPREREPRRTPSLQRLAIVAMWLAIAALLALGCLIWKCCR